MEQSSNDVQETKSTYSIISYAGSALPKQYRNMVFSKWMRSLKYGNESFKLVESDHYYWAYQKYIEMLLKKSDAIIKLAVLSDDTDIVLGWSVIRGDKLDYVWVDAMQRNKGIGKSLIHKNITAITHLTKSGARVWANFEGVTVENLECKKNKKIEFKPFN